MENGLNKTDYINYIQTEFEPGTREYNNIIQLYATLFNENQIESYGLLSHGLIRHAALCKNIEKERLIAWNMKQIFKDK